VATRFALRRVIEMLQLTAAASVTLIVRASRLDAMR
jgi:hypothetical protein